MKPLTIILSLLFLLSGCLPINLPRQPTVTPSAVIVLITERPASPTPAAPTLPATAAPSEAVETPVPSPFDLDVLKNYTYRLEEFNTLVPLKDGGFDDDRLNTRLVEPVTFGDLNGDGRQDAALVLATNSGGSGTFFDLIVLLDQDGMPVQAGSAGLGDRQRVVNLAVVDGRVVLDYFTQGLNDPSCCPSEHRLRSYMLENNVLRLASEQVLDSPEAQATALPNAILIDHPSDLQTLTDPQQVRGRVSQAPPKMVLAYTVINLQAVLLAQGEVALQGELGGLATFAFELSLGALPPGLVQLELVDSANGSLRGRSIVVLLVQ